MNNDIYMQELMKTRRTLHHQEIEPLIKQVEQKYKEWQAVAGKLKKAQKEFRAENNRISTLQDERSWKSRQKRIAYNLARVYRGIFDKGIDSLDNKYFKCNLAMVEWKDYEDEIEFTLTLPKRKFEERETYLDPDLPF